LTLFCFLFHNQWQAPEQFLKSAPLTHKADVYSLGNILYFLLTGNKPFHLLDPDKAEAKIRKGERPIIDEPILNSTHPFHVILRKAIDVCLEFNPEQRPDARSVVAFLRKSLADYNLTAFS
jgi:serine/threonine protein kinase